MLEFHPYSEPFPLIEGQEFDELVADIKANGVKEPIWLYEEKILDGRNRYRAALAAAVECPTRQYEGSDPITHVISLNVYRRHLSDTQRALIGAGLAQLPNGSNRHTMVNLGSSLELPRNSTELMKETDAAERVDVSVAAIKRAKTILATRDEELIAKVKNGEIPLTRAVKDLRKAQQAARASRPHREPRLDPKRFNLEPWQTGLTDPEVHAIRTRIHTAHREVLNGVDIDVRRKVAEHLHSKPLDFHAQALRRDGKLFFNPGWYADGIHQKTVTMMIVHGAEAKLPILIAAASSRFEGDQCKAVNLALYPNQKKSPPLHLVHAEVTPRSIYEKWCGMADDPETKALRDCCAILVLTEEALCRKNEGTVNGATVKAEIRKFASCFHHCTDPKRWRDAFFNIADEMVAEQQKVG